MHQFRRLRFICLALFIALLQAGLPALAYARMANGHGLLQEICTAGGARKVVVDEDGSAREVAPDSAHAEHCELCTIGGTTPVSTLIKLHESARNPGALRIGQTCFQAGSAINTPPATGPPSGS